MLVRHAFAFLLLVAGAGERRLGSLLDHLHLTGFVAPAVVAAQRLAGRDDDVVLAGAVDADDGGDTDGRDAEPGPRDAAVRGLLRIARAAGWTL